MNAFHRGHAITALEELSLIICIHCVLIASFPASDAQKHWQGELAGFQKVLRRLNNGKKGRDNFSTEIIRNELISQLSDKEEMETIEAFIAEKGLPSADLKWAESIAVAEQFSKGVLEQKA